MSGQVALAWFLAGLAWEYLVLPFVNERVRDFYTFGTLHTNGGEWSVNNMGEGMNAQDWDFRGNYGVVRRLWDE